MATANIKDVSMTYSSVLDIARAIDNKRLDFNGMCGTLKNLVDNLSNQWEGTAKREFLTAYNKIEPKLKLISETMEQYSKEIRKAVSEEQQQDALTAGTFDRFMCDYLPGLGSAGMLRTSSVTAYSAKPVSSKRIQPVSDQITDDSLPNTILPPQIRNNPFLFDQKLPISDSDRWIDTDLDMLPKWLRDDIYKTVPDLLNAGFQYVSDVNNGRYSWDRLESYYDLAELDQTHGSIISATLNVVTKPEGTMKKLMDNETSYSEEASKAFIDGRIGKGLLLLGKSFINGLGAIGYGVIDVPTELLASTVEYGGNVASSGMDIVGHIIPGTSGEVICRGAQRLGSLTETVTDWISGLL